MIWYSDLTISAQNANTRFLPDKQNTPFGVDFSNPGHLIGIASIVGGAGGLLYNVARGEDNLQVKPTLGGAVDQNGRIVPQFGLSLQVISR